MTENLAALFDEHALADERQPAPLRRPDVWSRASATFLDPPAKTPVKTPAKAPAKRAALSGKPPAKTKT